MVVNQSSYLFLRNNTFYFSSRIPLDMGNLYGSKRIVKSLKTRSKRVALRGSTQISFQLKNKPNRNNNGCQSSITQNVN